MKIKITTSLLGTERRHFHIKTSEGVSATRKPLGLQALGLQLHQCLGFGLFSRYLYTLMYKIHLYAHTYTGTWSEGEFPRVNCDQVQFQGCLFHVSDAPLCLWAPSSVGFLCHLRLPCARSPPHSGLCSEAEINL